MPQKSIPKIPCNQCMGTGKHPLREDMWKTLKMVRSMRGGTAQDVAKKIGWSFNKTAINNRLRLLMDLGFLTCERKGRHLFYTAI